jgi:hypothetical protein
VEGNVRGYHDLDHLVGMLPAAARIVNEVLQLQTRTIWQNLRKFYPQLITVQEGSKDATPAATQHWARQILGLEPIHWYPWIPPVVGAARWD